MHGVAESSAFMEGLGSNSEKKSEVSFLPVLLTRIRNFCVSDTKALAPVHPDPSRDIAGSSLVIGQVAAFGKVPVFTPQHPRVRRSSNERLTPLNGDKHAHRK